MSPITFESTYELFLIKQGKSEGFDSCDQPSNFAWNWIIIDFSVHVTLKFDAWPRKTIEHLFCITSSFEHHFKLIGELTLESQSRNAQFGTKMVIFCPVWPWVWWMILKNNRAPPHSKNKCLSFNTQINTLFVSLFRHVVVFISLML